MSESKALARAQWYALAAAFLGWMFDGVEMGLTPLVSRPALRDLLNTQSDAVVGNWNGPIMACFLLGAACGGVAFGWLGDKVGRVRAMVCSILAYSIFMGCGYFATHPWHIGLFLFISALGMGGQWSLGVSLVMECWPERHRPKLSGIIGAASNVGFLLIAVVGTFFPPTQDSWRWFMIVGASPALLALFIVFKVPESERWKAVAKQKGRSPLVEIFTPPLLRKTLLAIAFAGIPLIGTWAAISGWIPPWADKLAGDGQPHAKGIAQMALAIGAIIGCLIAPILGGMVGRRPVYFGLCVLSLGASQYMFRTMTAFNAEFVLMAGIVCCVTAAFYGWLPLYLSEIFPTRVRATGQGVSLNAGRVLAAGGALYMAQLMQVFDGDYGRAGSWITLVYILGMFLIWMAPETKGQPLPD
ncbi:MAG: MFS transporter [Planctomycetaceae bacterium]|nr:MFS transporter [Planctomycetaceae bacterium]